jgi:hypothetical protein
VQSARTLDRSQGGLGIGLSVVKRLVEMHGGRVAAASEGVGRGSTFEIRLPLLEAADYPAAEVQRPATRPSRILVVDDNQDAADSLAMMLALDGHEVRQTYAGAPAARLLARVPTRRHLARHRIARAWTGTKSRDASASSRMAPAFGSSRSRVTVKSRTSPHAGRGFRRASRQARRATQLAPGARGRRDSSLADRSMGWRSA